MCLPSYLFFSILAFYETSCFISQWGCIDEYYPMIQFSDQQYDTLNRTPSCLKKQKKKMHQIGYVFTRRRCWQRCHTHPPTLHYKQPPLISLNDKTDRRLKWQVDDMGHKEHCYEHEVFISLKEGIPTEANACNVSVEHQRLKGLRH